MFSSSSSRQSTQLMQYLRSPIVSEAWKAISWQTNDTHDKDTYLRKASIQSCDRYSWFAVTLTDEWNPVWTECQCSGFSPSVKSNKTLLRPVHVSLNSRWNENCWWLKSQCKPGLSTAARIAYSTRRQPIASHLCIYHLHSLILCIIIE